MDIVLKIFVGVCWLFVIYGAGMLFSKCFLWKTYERNGDVHTLSGWYEQERAAMRWPMVLATKYLNKYWHSRKYCTCGRLIKECEAEAIERAAREGRSPYKT